jgi:hypothetical protein
MIHWKDLTKNISKKDMDDFGEFRETQHEGGILAGIVVSKQSGKAYSIRIHLDTEHLDNNTKVKVYCNCDNFKFQWAYVLNKYSALIAPQNFILLPPKQTNPDLKIGCCKHIKVFLELAYEKRLRKINMQKGHV